MLECIKATTKYVKVSPKKAMLAADLIRNLSVPMANAQLLFCETKAGRLLKKTLKSAVANAETRFDLSREDLFVTEVRIDKGPALKRAKARSRGRRSPILKRTSHFTIFVSTKKLMEKK